LDNPKCLIVLPVGPDVVFFACGNRRPINRQPTRGKVSDVLDRLVNGWPMSKIDELMPWAYAAVTPERAVA
jgi:hypothetical protein